MNTKLLNKNFSIMVVGQFISLFGNSLQRFALSLLILDMTGSAAIFSFIIALTFLPQIFIAPFGGAIADRINKQKIMVFLDSFSGLFLLFFLLFLQTQSTPSLVSIGILMCVLSIIQSVYDPCVHAAIPAVTSQENLGSANSVVSVITSLTSLLGPIAAGFLYGLYGIKLVLIVNIVSFLASAIMELFLVIPQLAAKKAEGNLLRTFVTDIKQTFSYLTREKIIIFQMILISCSFNLFLTPIYTVGLPFMEKIIFRVSDQLYGISEGLVGAGMIGGAVLTGIIAKKVPFEKLYYYFCGIIVLVLGMGVSALPFLVSVSGPSMVSYVVFTACGFLFAFLLAIINILCMTYMQKEIPMEYMGKSMALIMAMPTALMPVGQLIFGGLYDAFASYTWMIYILVALCATVSTVVTYRMIKKAIGNGMLKTNQC